MSIESLPDYPLLKKLAEALWRNETSYQGAAIMVGSGFSRSAASSGDINSKLPLWNDLLKILSEDLGSDPWGDPLQIAEEYSSYFGKQALRDLIEQTVNDPAWIPSDLYGSLLKLPWTEVLTTNWDTLLERAASDIYKPIYSIVNKPEDLSSSRSPRIVKLHGTVQISHNLIFTQEDYRQYPKTHAAFVNLARQIFIENEFCLLGFSGDDPNFLQWVGWVRDHLASHARRIYLVGALDLSPAKRKYLESINVAPIDLSSLVKHLDNHDQRHREATKMFLNALQILKPKDSWDWEPTSITRKTIPENEIGKVHKEHSYAAALLETQLDQLVKDRESYPVWLVCPSNIRWSLQNQITDPFPNSKNLAEMKPDLRSKMLYEIVWRNTITFSVDAIHLAEELLEICDPSQLSGLTSKQQIEIALWLFRSTRWFDDNDYKKINSRVAHILDIAKLTSSEVKNEINYHKAILARESFDYSGLEELVEDIKATDPSWGMKKASLLAEMGRFDEGELLLKDAFKNLKLQSRNDPTSVYVLSRLAWVSFLLQGADFFNRNDLEVKPNDFDYMDSNPWTYLEHIRKRLSEALDKQAKNNSIEPSFDPGSYTDHSKSLSFSNELHPLLLVEGLTNTVGVPIRWRDVNFVKDIVENLAKLESLENKNRFIYAIRSSTSDTTDILKTTLSRINIAKLTEEDLEYLLDQTYKGCIYWLEKIIQTSNKSVHYYFSRLQVFMEALARFVIRAKPDKAIEVFKWGCSIAIIDGIKHFWLSKPYSHLIEYSLLAISDNRKSEIFEDALIFPLATEVNIDNDFGQRWPNPVVKLPPVRNDSLKISSRLDEIINHISPNNEDSVHALIKLFPLIENNYLNANELESIKWKIWGNPANYNFIPKLGILDHALLGLSGDDSQALALVVRKHLFESNDLINIHTLIAIKNLVLNEKHRELPTKKQSNKIFNTLTAWRFTAEDTDVPEFFIDNTEERLAKEIAYTLNHAITPYLGKSNLNEANLNKLLDFYEKTETFEVLSSFIFFSKKFDIAFDTLMKDIREGFYKKDTRKVVSSATALLNWCKLDFNDALKPLISKLIYSINLNRTSGLTSLIYIANELYSLAYLSNENISTLIEVIPIIFDGSAYENVNPASHLAINVTSVRTESIKLARNLLKNYSDSELKRIIEEAKTDPLPEVRFA